ncbi:MAG: acyl dehydratase [Dehalococcoidia bacterium]
MATQQLQSSPTFEDIEVGFEIPSLVKHPDVLQLWMFSAITWDTHRTHWDIPYSVEEEKLPGILTHGHLQGSFLCQMLSDWIGPEGRLKSINYQNRANCIAGDELTCKGRVKGKSEEGGPGLITCEVWVEKADGGVTTTGEAIVQLPRK